MLFSISMFSSLLPKPEIIRLVLVQFSGQEQKQPNVCSSEDVTAYLKAQHVTAHKPPGTTYGWKSEVCLKE